MRAVRRVGAMGAFLALCVLAGCTSSGGGGGPLYTGPAYSGTANPLGAKWDWGRIDDEAPYLARLAGGATFTTIVWCDVQRHQGDAYDWKQVDRQVTATHRLGFALFMKVRVGSCWATGGKGGFARGRNQQKTASAMPLDLGAYAAFVGAAVRRYAPEGVTEWAIENEVNSPSFWSGTPAQYETLVETAARAVRAADPRAEVLGCGISSTAYGVGIAARLIDEGQDAQAVAAYQQYYERRFSTRGAEYPPVHDAGELLRVISGGQAQRDLQFLAAERHLVTTRVVDAWQLHFYEDWESIPALLAYLHATLGPTEPIEAWEVGDFHSSGTTDAALGAAEVVKEAALLLAGGVRRVIWLPLAYNPAGQPGEPRLGLLDPGGQVREDGSDFALVARAAAGATAAPVRVHGLWGVVLSGRSGSTLAVVWGDVGDGTVTLRPPAGTAAKGLDQRATSAGPGGLSLGATPVFLTGGDALAAALGAGGHET